MTDISALPDAGATRLRRAIPATATQATWAAPDGWPLRVLAWAAPDAEERGSLLFLGGRGDHYEKYLESFEHWRGRGWRVESFDWRGQGGSGRLCDDPHVGHADDFALWVDDLAAYFAEWRARAPAPHVIIGHSMGGHLLLRALAEKRIAPDTVVLVAPMLGFTAPFPNWLGQRVASLMTRMGDPARAAWRVSEKPGSPPGMRQKLLTHDPGRYADEQWWREQNPALLLGPASWRWVEQSYASFRGLARPGLLEGVDTPLLILAARDDGLVRTAATQRMARRLPHAQIHVYGAGAAHELLREADAVRDDVLARIDRFVEEVAQPG